MERQKERKLKAQQLLFAKDSLLPLAPPTRSTLQPAPNLSALFEECHNYIYANEGLLKEKIFHEFVKLLLMKLHDEQASDELQFGVGFAVLRNVHGVEPLYLLAYMRTEFFLRQVRRLMTGHAIPAISNDDLAKIIVPIPSRAEQKQVADAISAIMAMRRETLKAGERIVTETEWMIRAQV